MKQMLIVLALVFSTLAVADSKMIFETRDYYRYEAMPKFEFNESLGRAWVNVEIAENWGDDTSFYDNRVKIEGMSFNAADRTIVLERNGEEIICASLYNRRYVIDGGRSIRNSGRCTFSVKKETIEVDNGFEINRVRVLRVYMTVK